MSPAMAPEWFSPLRPLVPIIDVHVGAADRSLGDLDEQSFRADRGVSLSTHKKKTKNERKNA